MNRYDSLNSGRRDSRNRKRGAAAARLAWGGSTTGRSRMKRPVLTLFLAFAVMALAGAQAASAGHGHGNGNGNGNGNGHGHRGHGVVFVQTNQPDGNAIAVYDRGDDGL